MYEKGEILEFEKNDLDTARKIYTQIEQIENAEKMGIGAKTKKGK